MERQTIFANCSSVVYCLLCLSRPDISKLASTLSYEPWNLSRSRAHQYQTARIAIKRDKLSSNGINSSSEYFKHLFNFDDYRLSTSPSYNGMPQVQCWIVMTWDRWISMSSSKDLIPLATFLMPLLSSPLRPSEGWRYDANEWFYIYKPHPIYGRTYEGQEHKTLNFKRGSIVVTCEILRIKTVQLDSLDVE
jgi:hypothetical protein